jgi:AbiV family abortive infection protein
MTLGELRLLAPAAARNARDLLTDAEILLERQRWPRAYSLAMLAREETAKAFKCLSVVVLGCPQQARHGIERGHLGKLAMARVMTGLLFPLWKEELELPPSLAEATARMEELARQDDRAKQRGLYADIGPDSSLRQPSDISERDARTAVEGVADIVRIVSFMTSSEMTQIIANPPPEAQAEFAEFMERLTSAHAAGGDDAAAAVLVEQMRINRARFGDQGIVSLSEVASGLADRRSWLTAIREESE